MFNKYLWEAYDNLVATKMRTILAMVGILVGTASVVAMVSSGELATQAALAQFKSLGTDMLAVSLFSQGSNQNSPDTNDLSLTDIERMQEKIPEIKMLAPYSILFTPVLYQGNSVNVGITGITETLASVMTIKMQQGRFISDLDKNSNYAVVGKNLPINLEIKDPIGSQIRLGNEIFTIIGVMDQAPENQFFNQDINSAIFIPLAATKQLNKLVKVDSIVMRIDPNADPDTIKNKITDYLNSVSAGKKMFFRSAKELIKSMTAQHRILTWLLGLIGSVSLLVGGIGVMNIMLVSVLERRREIGIRLALGAKRFDVQWMFLSEAILLSLTGGLLGVLVGVITSYIVAEFANWPFSILMLPPTIGFTVSLLIGVFFGFYPARQAARLDPITTLRIDL